MSTKEWAKACGSCVASYQARMSLLVAEVCSTLGKDKHVLMWQLQLKKWPASHSFFLNLRKLHGAVEVTPTQIEQLTEAASAMPLLHSLHIIGRQDVPLTATSLEGVLMSLLAKHATVLTLHVKTVSMALDMPNLRHLVLRGTNSREVGNKQIYKELFLAVSGFKGLETLYVHYHNLTIRAAVDLTSCEHLQHMAVQGIQFAASLTLPVACVLHTTGEPPF